MTEYTADIAPCIASDHNFLTLLGCFPVPGLSVLTHLRKKKHCSVERWTATLGTALQTPSARTHAHLERDELVDGVGHLAYAIVALGAHVQLERLAAGLLDDVGELAQIRQHGEHPQVGTPVEREIEGELQEAHRAGRDRG